jgi:glycosyltransferase involved in cell wall biosynthesis
MEPVLRFSEAEPVQCIDNKETTRVSVIMLTYNRPHFLNRAIGSVIEQDYKDWELIVVDDGSDRETEQLMLEWLARDSRVRYCHREKAGNIANAMNFGIKQARGEYIAVLDDDDYWVPIDKLSRQVRFLDDNTSYVGCGGGAIVVDENCREKLRYVKLQEDEALRKWALISNPIHHSTSMFRRPSIFQCGLYDESLAGFQDWDVFLKLAKTGRLYNFPEALVCYTMWHGSGSFLAERANCGAAITIILRHRKAYQGFVAAFGLSVLHYVYACLPRRIKQTTFSFLSRAKKRLFAERHAATLKRSPTEGPSPD